MRAFSSAISGHTSSSPFQRAPRSRIAHLRPRPASSFGACAARNGCANRSLGSRSPRISAHGDGKRSPVERQHPDLDLLDGEAGKQAARVLGLERERALRAVLVSIAVDGEKE